MLAFYYRYNLLSHFIIVKDTKGAFVKRNKLTFRGG